MELFFSGALKAKFQFGAGCILFLYCVTAATIAYHFLKGMVSDEIYKETLILESAADATRTYVKDVLRPPPVAVLMPPDGFTPQAMSTFRNIPGPTNSDDVPLPLTTGDEVDQLKRAFEIVALELQQTHNNLKASETKYRLMFETSQDTITISDTGQGGPRENIPKIFDPFFTTKGPEKGTGLTWPFISGIVSCFVLLCVGFRYLPE